MTYQPDISMLHDGETTHMATMYRQVKATRITDWLLRNNAPDDHDAIGRTLITAEVADGPTWIWIAQRAHVTPPSKLTVKSVINNLRLRQEMAAPDFDPLAGLPRA